MPLSRAEYCLAVGSFSESNDWARMIRLKYALTKIKILNRNGRAHPKNSSKTLMLPLIKFSLRPNYNPMRSTSPAIKFRTHI